MGEVVGAISTNRDEVRVERGSVNTLAPSTTNTLISLTPSNDERIHGLIIDGTHPGTWKLDVGGSTKLQISTTASNLGDVVDIPGYLSVASGESINVIVENVDALDNGDYQASLVLNND